MLVRVKVVNLWLKIQNKPLETAKTPGVAESSQQFDSFLKRRNPFTNSATQKTWKTTDMDDGSKTSLQYPAKPTL